MLDKQDEIAENIKHIVNTVQLLGYYPDTATVYAV